MRKHGHLKSSLLIPLCAALLTSWGCGLRVDQLPAAEGSEVGGTEAPSAVDAVTAPVPGAVTLGSGAGTAPEVGGARAQGSTPLAVPTQGGAAQPAAGSGGRAGAQPTPGQPAAPGSSAGATGSGSGATAGAGSAVPAEPGPGSPAVKSEIRLGSIGIGSGPLGYVTQPIRDASKAWVASVNSRGGVNGHPVRLLFGDDGADPARALALAKRFVEQDKVQTMFGLHMPTTEQAIVPYLIDKRIPTVGTCNCNPASDDNPLAFNVGPGPTVGFTWEHLLSVLGQTDAKKIAVLYCREATTCEVVYKNMRQFTDKLGVEIVQGSQVSLAQPDYTAEVLAARNAGAQGIIGVVENQSAVRILRSARRQGWDVPVGSQHSVMDDRMLALPDARGLLGAVITADYQTHPAFEEYRQAMARLPGSIKGNTGSIQWAAGLMLEKAGSRFGDTVTPDDIMEGLYSLRDETLGGLIPPTTYKRGVPHKDANLCAIPIVIGDGKFDFPKGPEFRCAPGWKPAQP